MRRICHFLIYISVRSIRLSAYMQNSDVFSFELNISIWMFVGFQDYSWTDIRCPFEKRRDATSVFWDNVVYILGGSQLFPIKRMDCYNVVKDSWYSKLGPPNPRDSLAACASKGKIYTSGGSEVGEFVLEIEKSRKRHVLCVLRYIYI